MKYVGILLVLFGTYFFNREYSRHMRRRLAECEAFLAFISHMQIQIGCFLRPVSELAAEFESPELEAVGFLAALRKGENIYDAFKASRQRLALTDGECEILEELFSSLGSVYFEGGMKMIELSYSRLDVCRARLKEECPKCIKLATVLSVTAALAFLIFVI